MSKSRRSRSEDVPQPRMRDADHPLAGQRQSVQAQAQRAAGAGEGQAEAQDEHARDTRDQHQDGRPVQDEQVQEEWETDEAQEAARRRMTSGNDHEGVTAAAARNDAFEPVRLMRRVDAEADGLATVELDHGRTDLEGPNAGEEGGAPLGEPADRHHAPGAPWPGPATAEAPAAAASPTASPQPAPEPEVQFDAPQPIRFENKAEGAVGVAGPSPEEQEERLRAERERHAFGVDERVYGGTAEEQTGDRVGRRRQAVHTPLGQPRDTPDDGLPRDEAGAITIAHLSEVAIAAIGGVFKGATDMPEPRKVQLALQDAARRVMSPQWHGINDKHFT